ncbi:MAG: hypothetical protein K6F50_04005, partial [Kiritimatiellae bacterium]|nr:hypothetical protein [Kiritimatiellia bacterium]
KAAPPVEMAPAVKAAALAGGFVEAELPKVAKAVKFIAETRGIDEEAAIARLLTRGSEESRLFEYGGRFMESAGNFASGLRLIGEFRDWFSALRDSYNAHRKGADMDLSKCRSVDEANATSSILASKGHVAGLEALVFEDIAVDASVDLEHAGKEIFAVDKNRAVRYANAGYINATLGSLFAVPPEKRQVIYDIFDRFTRVAKTLDEAKDIAETTKGGNAYKVRVDCPQLLLGRILKNLPELELMGRLASDRDIINVCFPEAKKMQGPCDNEMLKRISDRIDDELREAYEDSPNSAWAARDIMERTGCPAKEAIAAYDGKAMPPLPKYSVNYSYGLSDHNVGGKNQAEIDLVRSYNYSTIDRNGKVHDDEPLLRPDSVFFGVKFPDGTECRVNATPELMGNAKIVSEKVGELCGKAHARQANIALFCLSQSGLSVMKRRLVDMGVYSTEHSVVNYSISKDAKSGSVKIDYSSPDDLPVKFSWSVTIDVNGNMETSPFASGRK